jgi:hypothetical protein
MTTSRWITWAGHVVYTRKMKNSYKTSLRKAEGKTT